MELDDGETVTDLNLNLWLGSIVVSSEHLPNTDYRLMLTPSLMVGFTISNCNKRTIARPVNRYSLVIVVKAFYFGLWFIFFFFWLRVFIIPFIVLGCSFNFIHLIKSLLNGQISFDKIIACAQ
jgi:hypothetical protein